MAKMEYGIKVAKELRDVGRMALVGAIVDELVEYDRKFKVEGAKALLNVSQKAKVLMGLAYSEFLTEDGNDYILAEEKRRVLLEVLNLDGYQLRKDVERLLRN